MSNNTENTISISPNTYVAHSIEDANDNNFILQPNVVDAIQDLDNNLQKLKSVLKDINKPNKNTINNICQKMSPASLALEHLQMNQSVLSSLGQSFIKQQIDWHSECIVCHLPCELLISIKYKGDFFAKMQAIRKEIRKYGWELLAEVVNGQINPISAHISCRAMEKIEAIKRDSVVIEGQRKEEGDGE